MLGILGKPTLSSNDLNLVHAEVLGVFEQPHYHGAQLWFTSILVDLWLSAADPEGKGSASLEEAYRAHLR